MAFEDPGPHEDVTRNQDLHLQSQPRMGMQRGIKEFVICYRSVSHNVFAVKSAQSLRRLNDREILERLMTTLGMVVWNRPPGRACPRFTLGMVRT